MKDLKLCYRQLKIKNKKYKYKFKEYELPNITYKAIGGLYYQKDKQRLIVGVLQDESNKILFIDEDDLKFQTSDSDEQNQPTQTSARGRNLNMPTPDSKITPGGYSDDEQISDNG